MTDASLIPAFVNRGSGSFKKARDALASAGRFDLHEVEPSKLESEIERGVAAGAKRILIAGGDGSICAAAQVVTGSDVELAILPGGTLNHFASDHGIPLDPDEAVKVAIGPKTTTVDVGFAGERVFLNTSSIGAYVTFVRMRDRLERRFGYRLASLIATSRIFALMPTIGVELEVANEVKNYRTPIFFVGVGERELQLPHLGDRVKDGKRGLHIFVVGTRQRARLLVVAFEAVARGVEKVRRMPELDAFVLNKCKVDLRRPMALIAFDGETQMMPTPLAYRIERDALRIVVPEEADVSEVKAAAAHASS
ncbi:MAG: diacylglycerol kinase family protein [Gemmatimonadaceae bacterium]